MLQYIIDKIDYDVEWRLARTKAIRFLVYSLLLFLFIVSFNANWEEIRPITGQYSDYIFVNGTAPKNEVKAMEKFLKNLPAWLVDYHKEKGSILSLREKSFPLSKSGNNKYGRTVGQFNTVSTHIQILNNKATMERTVYHEYGHFLDSIYSITESENFRQIFSEEKQIYFEKVEEREYIISCESEYFAGAFAEYILNGKKLKRYCPKTYDIIKFFAERKKEK